MKAVRCCAAILENDWISVRGLRRPSGAAGVFPQWHVFSRIADDRKAQPGISCQPRRTRSTSSDSRAHCWIIPDSKFVKCTTTFLLCNCRVLLSNKSLNFKLHQLLCIYIYIYIIFTWPYMIYDLYYYESTTEVPLLSHHTALLAETWYLHQCLNQQGSLSERHSSTALPPAWWATVIVHWNRAALPAYEWSQMKENAYWSICCNKRPQRPVICFCVWFTVHTDALGRGDRRGTERRPHVTYVRGSTCLSASLQTDQVCRFWFFHLAWRLRCLIINPFPLREQMGTVDLLFLK